MTILVLIIIFLALVVAWIHIAITGGSIKKQWCPLVIYVFVGWNLLVPLAIRSATYGGKVVDEETGAPLAGAVVTVIWHTSPIIYMDQSTTFLSADETVTQNDGSFSLWTWPGFSFNPLTSVQVPPEQTTYDRGYTSYEGLADALKKGVVMKIPKVRTTQEALNFSGPPVSAYMPNHFSIPNLVKEVNIHRKKIGLKSEIYKR